MKIKENDNCLRLMQRNVYEISRTTSRTQLLHQIWRAFIQFWRQSLSRRKLQAPALAAHSCVFARLYLLENFF